MTKQTKGRLVGKKDMDIFNKMDNAHQFTINKCLEQGRKCLLENMIINPKKMTPEEFRDKVVGHMDQFVKDMKTLGFDTPDWGENWMFVLATRLGMTFES